MKKRVIAWLLTCVMLASAIPFSAAGETATEEPAAWEYEAAEGGILLTKYNGTATDVYIPNKVDDLAVVGLGESLFENNDTLNSATLAKGIQTIGDRAFYDCDQLVTVVLNEDLATIGEEVFSGCDVFNSIILYDGLTAIGANAFAECPSLTVWCNEGTAGYTYATENGIPYEILNPEATPEIVTVDDITYYIMNGEAIAVDYTDTATEVTVPAAVNGYPVAELRETFKDCKTLVSVTLPEGLKVIGKEAFHSCSKLQSVYIPGSVTTIGTDAFRNCDALTAVDLPIGVTSIGTGAFCGCNALTEIEIPEGITTIAISAFSLCDALASVKLPESVTVISNGAFSYCKSLSSVTLPEGVKTISVNAFGDCTALRKVLIPADVTSMSAASFPTNTVLMVYEESYAHTFAVEKDLLYFIYDGTAEPQIVEQEEIVYALMDGEAIAVDYTGTATKVTVPAAVNGYPVTELRETFKDCKTLVSVTLPEGLQIIGEDAFYSCYKLQSVYIPGSVTTIGTDAFRYCYALTAVDLPIGVTSIGIGVFAFCHALTEIEIPEGITTIADLAFSSCDALTSVKLPESVTVISYNAFYSCKSLSSVTLPEGVKTIRGNAFGNCTALRKVLIPVGVTSMDATSFPTNTVLMVYEDSYAHTFAVEKDLLYFIYDGTAEPQIVEQDGIVYALMNGEAIAIDYTGTATEVTVPATVNGYPVTELRETFEDCKTLVSVTLPEGLQVIGKEAFCNCYKLQLVHIPESVTTIGNSAFRSCHALPAVDLPIGVTSIGTYAFHGCNALTEIEIPEGITTIADSAFSSCDALASVKLPESVTVISYGAFSSCESLSSVTLPEGVKTISGYAFGDCTALRKVLIPAGVTSINATSFPTNTILMVYEDSYAHTFAVEKGLLYFIMRKTENPEIAYGSGISGTVRYTDGTAAAGATVEIFYEDGALKESVATDETGAYEFTYAEVGAYTVKVTDANGNTASGAVSVKRMNTFDVFVAGDTDYTLKQGWSVSGSVSAAPATVTLTDEDGNVIDSVVTENGDFTLENVPNGTYILKAETDTGSVTQEVTVFNGNMSEIELTVETNTATLWGYVEVEDRKFEHHRRNWVQVTLYNDEGIAVAQTKSDSDGKYRFNNLPLGNYTVVAEVGEMRPDKKHGYDRNHTLTGYAYVEVTDAIEYQVETIVLYEENDHLATLSGKVTANGETQDCEVVLCNVFRHEVAKLTTGKNGKYTFKNVKDGLYFITATTESDGMGYAVVVVRDGKVYGETDITVYKTDKIKDREDRFRNEVPECESREDAYQHKDRIAEEKRFYDGLSEKEKKQLSKDYVDRLNRYSEWLANTAYTTNDETVTVEQGGLVVSGDELANEDTVLFNLNVEKYEDYGESTDGVHNEKDFIHHNMRDAAGKGEIKEYYEITMTKTVDGKEQAVTSVHKDTDATGKFRITMEIPEEYRGHKHYQVLHVHHGEVVTLADLDDDPNTVTFEVDRFSTFALSATDEELTEVIDFTAGDVNTDGRVDLLDAIILLQKLSGNLPENVNIDLRAANVVETYEGEYAVNTADATRLLQYITGVRVDGALVELNASSVIPSVII